MAGPAGLWHPQKAWQSRLLIYLLIYFGLTTTTTPPETLTAQRFAPLAHSRQNTASCR